MKNKNLIFNKTKMTLLLNVSKLFKIDKKIIQKHNLNLKKEQHITIVGNRTGFEILDILKTKNRSEKKFIIQELVSLYGEFDWKYEIKNKIYFLEKNYESEKRNSVVVEARLLDTKIFYKKLNKLLNTNFETPFIHITIATNSTKKKNKLLGIGLYSKDDFKKYKTKI